MWKVDNCVPEYLLLQVNIPSPNADNGCCYFEQLRENNSQDILSSTHRIVLLYNTEHTAHYDHQSPSFAIAGVSTFPASIGLLQHARII